MVITIILNFDDSARVMLKCYNTYRKLKLVFIDESSLLSLKY